MKRKIIKKISELEKEIWKLACQLTTPKFPGQEKHHDEAIDGRRELENLHRDLAILKEVESGDLDLKKEAFYEREAENLNQALSNIQNIVIGLRAEIAKINRVKALIKNRR